MSDLRHTLLAAILANPVAIENGRAHADGVTSRVVETLEAPRGQPLRKSRALHTLLALADRLEDHLGRLISQHSLRWWLSIARKIPLEEFVRSQMYSTSVQIRWTFDRAIVKYGDTSGEDILQGEDGSWGPDLYVPPDLEYFFHAFFLARNLYYVASCYRRVAKGAELRLGVSDYECKAPSDADKMMRLFDERKQQYGDLLDVFGSPYAMGNVISDRSASDETLVPLVNFSGGIDPVSWTLSERRIRCPEWDQPRRNDGRDDSSQRSSGPVLSGWSWMRARRLARWRASSI